MSNYQPKYFSPREFNICTPGCDISQMDENFLKKLDLLREYCGFPLVLSCAFRSVEYDKAKGRSGESFHCKGCAVDIICTDSFRRWDIVHNAMYCGFNGIGIGKNFIHIDDRTVSTMWHYYD